MHGSRWYGRGEEGIYIYIYQKGYHHGQDIQLLSVIMLHDLCVTVCVCSEDSALFHIRTIVIFLAQHHSLIIHIRVMEVSSHCKFLPLRFRPMYIK